MSLGLFLGHILPHNPTMLAVGHAVHVFGLRLWSSWTQGHQTCRRNSGGGQRVRGGPRRWLAVSTYEDTSRRSLQPRLGWRCRPAGRHPARQCTALRLQHDRANGTRTNIAREYSPFVRTVVRSEVKPECCRYTQLPNWMTTRHSAQSQDFAASSNVHIGIKNGLSNHHGHRTRLV
ncbi:uncharacterized protein M421DRAFT_94254 [Didymella exigua CBS 183.55]|uniref:Uncharacterized protein n=1 Tax=Didymella exigua CBS 183.55 TaxID=1150837 RepID=A0A6A5RD09_9PLEO|nr:uncharacterized protein M421DRAFT_94254 [Didymella exigua CBS 183.55]KAF1926135.1 hypothetical protein M421DRAFT_94254 [Didymella exigua CBS 183.55]